jgi:hypothetical protein
VKILGGDIDTIKKNTQTLIEVCGEVGMEATTEKTKYMLLSCQKNAGHNLDIKIANRSFENVAQFKYLGTTLTTQIEHTKVQFCLWLCMSVKLFL